MVGSSQNEKIEKKLTTRDINDAIENLLKKSSRIKISGLNGQDSIAVGIQRNVEITVEGNPGCFLGAFNQRAVITLHGNASDYAGDTLLGGGLIILGKAGFGVGTCMNSGIIVVKGNVLGGVGFGMYGGTIIIDGNVEGNIGGGIGSGTLIISGNLKGGFGAGHGSCEMFIGGKHDPPGTGLKEIPLSNRDVSKLTKYFQHYAIQASPGIFTKYRGEP
ncbi:MAG: hypothetical protein ACMUIE_07565 [Thermoplasmatota archaeon]